MDLILALTIFITVYISYIYEASTPDSSTFGKYLLNFKVLVVILLYIGKFFFGIFLAKKYEPKDDYESTLIIFKWRLLFDLIFLTLPIEILYWGFNYVSTQGFWHYQLPVVCEELIVLFLSIIPAYQKVQRRRKKRMMEDLEEDEA